MYFRISMRKNPETKELSGYYRLLESSRNHNGQACHRIHGSWSEIVRIMNTQKVVTTLAQNDKDEVIQIRRCTEPNQKAQKLYDALKYKYAPFVKKKSVVLKSEPRE